MKQFWLSILEYLSWPKISIYLLVIIIPVSFRLGRYIGYRDAEKKFELTAYWPPAEGEPAVTLMVKDCPMMEIIDGLRHLGYTYAMLPNLGGIHKDKFRPVTLSAWDMPISEFLKKAFLQEP